MTTPTKPVAKKRRSSQRAVYDEFGDLQGYEPVGSRTSRAEAAANRLRADGHEINPVTLVGKGPKGLAVSAWGRAWCSNIESYVQYAHVLPRGRSLVRNGCVLDLKIDQGVITAMIYGDTQRHVTIRTKSSPGNNWESLKHKCAGSVSSLASLLQGAIPAEIMLEMTRPEGGLMPTPEGISFSCDCTDWAELCEHAAAALYGVAIRLDTQPHLLFHWNGVNPQDIIAVTLESNPPSAHDAATPLMPEDDLSSLFGIELE